MHRNQFLKTDGLTPVSSLFFTKWTKAFYLLDALSKMPLGSLVRFLLKEFGSAQQEVSRHGPMAFVDKIMHSSAKTILYARYEDKSSVHI